MNFDNIKVSIFKNMQSYESRPVGLQEICWFLQNDQDVKNKTELYRNLPFYINLFICPYYGANIYIFKF